MYALLLGPAFETLPDSIRALHRSPGSFRHRGECRVRRGDRLVSRLLGFAAALPPAGITVLDVAIESDGKNEVWRRGFGSHRMQSRLAARDGLLRESLGLARLAFRLHIEEGGVRWKLVEVRALGVTLPRRWFDLDVSERDVNGRYHFDVRVEIRGVGLLVHYAGWLA
ncbi:hypothetical protein SVA_2558 [Sulfurifustis variabilis]|uniref:DUF4166 domain-containing protein n=1 Tax=Sulfurifustis variabilis TaxID=1675686 RepID=A0A1B4V6D5_9GAMM|nr:DUF4166 domain-containing protein [Sulfurifustis variabilis]BAU49106.1 hypothetical protein SVA_2558 [Sulfurifustis variabilis]